MRAHEHQSLIEQRCADFVGFKDALDRFGKNQPRASSLRERLGEGLSCRTPPRGEPWTAILPATFCSVALPFSDPLFDYASMVPESVDPRLVISGTYRTYPNSADPHEAMDRSNALVDEDARYHAELPRLAQIGNLPLYVAIEGKNRVKLFKQHRSTMRAMVTKTHFPSPHELRLVRLWPFGVHALAHGTSTRILPFPTCTVPLLRAYGVPKGKGFWDFPASARRCRKQKYICSQQMWG